MWEYLRFPEKYHVKKQLGKDNFLKSKNLSEAEKRYFGLAAENIKSLYDIKFQDGSEMIVLGTEADILRSEWSEGEHRLRQYCRTIAQAIPYQCMIVLKYKSALKFILPQERINTKNNCRRVVEKFHSTSLINMDIRSSTEPLIITKMRDSIEQSHSADELFERWLEIIRDGWSGEMDNWRFTCEQEEIDDILKADRKFSMVTTIGRGRHATLHTIPSAEDEPDEVLCVAFLADNGWPLFKEYMGREVMNSHECQQEWIELYCTLCMEMYQEAFLKELSQGAIRDIVESFEQRKVPIDKTFYDDMADIMETLREKLDECLNQEQQGEEQ